MRRRAALATLITCVIYISILRPPVGNAAGSDANSELRQQLDEIAADFNLLFSRPKVAIVTDSARFKQRQTFLGPYVKLANGDWEQRNICDTAATRTGSATTQTAVQRLTIEQGKIVVYATYTSANGSSEVYGPSAVERRTSAIVFRDTDESWPGAWEATEFFMQPNGTVGSLRRWKGQPENNDEWVEVDPNASFPQAAQAKLGVVNTTQTVVVEANPFAEAAAPAAAVPVERGVIGLDGEIDSYDLTPVPPAAAPADNASDNPFGN